MSVYKYHIGSDGKLYSGTTSTYNITHYVDGTNRTTYEIERLYVGYIINIEFDNVSNKFTYNVKFCTYDSNFVMTNRIGIPYQYMWSVALYFFDGVNSHTVQCNIPDKRYTSGWWWYTDNGRAEWTWTFYASTNINNKIWCSAYIAANTVYNGAGLYDFDPRMFSWENKIINTNWFSDCTVNIDNTTFYTRYGYRATLFVSGESGVTTTSATNGVTVTINGQSKRYYVDAGYIYIYPSDFGLSGGLYYQATIKRHHYYDSYYDSGSKSFYIYVYSTPSVNFIDSPSLSLSASNKYFLTWNFANNTGWDGMNDTVCINTYSNTLVANISNTSTNNDIYDTFRIADERSNNKSGVSFIPTSQMNNAIKKLEKYDYTTTRTTLYVDVNRVSPSGDYYKNRHALEIHFAPYDSVNSVVYSNSVTKNLYSANSTIYNTTALNSLSGNIYAKLRYSGLGVASRFVVTYVASSGNSADNITETYNSSRCSIAESLTYLYPNGKSHYLNTSVNTYYKDVTVPVTSMKTGLTYNMYVSPQYKYVTNNVYSTSVNTLVCRNIRRITSVERLASTRNVRGIYKGGKFRIPVQLPVDNNYDLTTDNIRSTYRYQTLKFIVSYNICDINITDENINNPDYTVTGYSKEYSYSNYAHKTYFSDPTNSNTYCNYITICLDKISELKHAYIKKIEVYVDYDTRFVPVSSAGYLYKTYNFTDNENEYNIYMNEKNLYKLKKFPQTGDIINASYVSLVTSMLCNITKFVDTLYSGESYKKRTATTVGTIPNIYKIATTNTVFGFSNTSNTAANSLRTINNYIHDFSNSCQKYSIIKGEKYINELFVHERTTSSTARRYYAGEEILYKLWCLCEIMDNILPGAYNEMRMFYADDGTNYYTTPTIDTFINYMPTIRNVTTTFREKILTNVTYDFNTSNKHILANTESKIHTDLHTLLAKCILDVYNENT